MNSSPDPCVITWDESLFDLKFLQDYPLLKPSVYDHAPLVPIVDEMDQLQESHSPPPPGTILMYSTHQSLQSDNPEVVGSVGPLTGMGAGHLNSLHIHCAIRNTIKHEFQIEDNYHQLTRRGLLALPRDKRRRNPTVCEWKPESVYKTYVDCKPVFFEKSDYQDHIPSSSCFGKINMRIPKAWIRGPNRPKRRRVRRANTSSEPTTRLSSSADHEEGAQGTEPSFDPQFNPENPLGFDFFFP